MNSPQETPISLFVLRTTRGWPDLQASECREEFSLKKGTFTSKTFPSFFCVCVSLFLSFCLSFSLSCSLSLSLSFLRLSQQGPTTAHRTQCSEVAAAGWKPGLSINAGLPCLSKDKGQGQRNEWVLSESPYRVLPTFVWGFHLKLFSLKTKQNN